MTNGNDQAFPHNTFTDSHMQGLTKREYFAALCLQGFCSNEGWSMTETNMEILSEGSVKQADALIVELNKDKE